MLEVGVTPDIKASEFALIRDFANKTFGLDLRNGRELLVSARLGKHIRAGGFRSFAEYFRFVQADRTGESLTALIDALATNHTSFLREKDHFDFLVNKVVPEWSGRSSVSVWSAACSTGEEPYSILFSLADAFEGRTSPIINITASDISTKVLKVAGEGAYSADKIRGIPQHWLRKYFDASRAKQEDIHQVRAEWRARILFRRFNLMQPVPAGQRYSVIFCRNVMIYFNRTTQSALVNRLANCLEPGGYLFVGHAESLTGIDHPLTYVRPAVYRKNR
jgi:chemotaxis protein methyltransferase CheR